MIFRKLEKIFLCKRLLRSFYHRLKVTVYLHLLWSHYGQPQRIASTLFCMLDEALGRYHTQMNARVDDMLAQPEVEVKSVREKIWAFKESQMRLGDAKGIIVGNVYIKFEEYLREGYGDGKGAFSALKAERIIAKTVFPLGTHTRKNVSKKSHKSEILVPISGTCHNHWLQISCSYGVPNARAAREVQRYVADT
jgi:hypothetical protein